jgi:hypothetical protein
LGRQQVQIYSFDWKQAYDLTGRTFANLGLSVSHWDYEQGSDFTKYQMDAGVGYDYSSKLHFGLAPYVGTSVIQSGGGQTFQGIRFGTTYDSLANFSFHGSVAVQALQYRGINTAGASNFVTPIFELGFLYRSSEKRSFTVDLQRGVQNSSQTSGQTYIYTRASVGMRQELSRGWSLGLDLNSTINEYQGNAVNSRTDTYLSASPSLNYTFWHGRCIWSVYYRRTQRISDLNAYNFEANVIGTGLSLKY